MLLSSFIFVCFCCIIMAALIKRLMVRIIEIEADKTEVKLDYRGELDKWRKIALDEHKRAEALAKGAIKPAKGFTKDEIVFMLKQCHPDRNGNSGLANEVTKKLVKMR